MRFNRLRDSKKTITILWRASAEGDAIVIRDGFPKDVAVTFSSFAKSKFPSTKTLTLAQMQTHREPTCITITHPRKQSVEKVLDWMIESCQGTGLKPHKIEVINSVTNAYYDLGVASYLGISYLVTKINDYLNHRLTAGFIHATDMQTLLETVTNEDPVFDLLVQHVAIRVWRDMKLRNNPSGSNNSAAPDKNKNQKRTQKQGLPRPKSQQYNAVRGAREDPTVFGIAVNKKIREYKQAERAAPAAAAAAAAGQS